MLQEHALLLVLEQGFDETTATQITAVSGVSPMSFFRHFASKAAAGLDDPYDRVIADRISTTARIR